MQKIPKKPDIEGAEAFIHGKGEAKDVEMGRAGRDIRRDAARDNEVSAGGVKIFPLRLSLNLHGAAMVKAKAKDMSLHSYILKLITDDIGY